MTEVEGMGVRGAREAQAAEVAAGQADGVPADARARAEAAAVPPAGTGVFITLEGIDGTGKSTQVELLAERLREAGYEVVALREPGGTPISEKIRALLLDCANAEMADECELLLYEASRAQLVRERIEPALARGAVVVCDRYYDSTHAYQAAGRGLSAELVERANRLGSCGLVPALTVVLDMEPAAAYARATATSADRLEAAGLAFQERVRADYLALAKAEPVRFAVVSAAGSRDEVAGRIDAALAPVLPRLASAGAGKQGAPAPAATAAAPEGGATHA